MLLALALTAQLLATTQSDDSAARIDRVPSSEDTTPVPEITPAPAAAPERGSPRLQAGPTTRKKSVSIIASGLGIIAGSITSYLALAGGVAVNFSKGGLSDPFDSDDILLLMVLPAATAAVTTWFIGLLDWSQRGVFSSLLWAVLGAGAGELIGLGAGTLIGRAMYPTDLGARGIVTVFIAPAVAVLGAVIFMELFKPGEEVEGAYASLSVARTQNGGLAFGPAVGFRF